MASRGGLPNDIFQAIAFLSLRVFDKNMIGSSESSPALKKSELLFASELARGGSVAQAAQAAGVSEPTGYRWAKKAEIRCFVEQVRAEVLQSAASRITRLTARAVDVLGKLLSNPDPKVQLAASRHILDGACKLRQLAGLEEELAVIQSKLNELQLQKSRRGVA